MADQQENKDFSEDVAEQNFEKNGEAEAGGVSGGGDAVENGQDSQEDRYGFSRFYSRVVDSSRFRFTRVRLIPAIRRFERNSNLRLIFPRVDWHPLPRALLSVN